MWNAREAKVESYSFGMKQRLAFACSIAHDPSIVLLDEPTSGLDKQSNSNFEKFIKQMEIERKIVVIASHDHDMINRVCNFVLMIKDGILSVFSKNFME